jgi:hypothetical protein
MTLERISHKTSCLSSGFIMKIEIEISWKLIMRRELIDSLVLVQHALAHHYSGSSVILSEKRASDCCNRISLSFHAQDCNRISFSALALIYVN